MMQQPQGSMHPEDKRNLIIFFALCLAGYFLYDVLVSQPRLKQAEAARAVAAKQVPVAAEPAAVLTETEALALSPRIEIDNPDLHGSLSLKGGRIDDLALRQYFETIEKTKPVTLLAPARTAHPLYLDFGWLGDNVPTPDGNTAWQVKNAGSGALSKDNPVTLAWSNGQGLAFEQTYKLDDQYMFTVTQSVINNSGAPVTLYPYAALTRQGLPADFVKNAVMHEGPIGFIGGDLHEVGYHKFDKEPRRDFSGGGWAGFTDKYWFSGIISRGGAAENNPSFRFVKSDAARAPVYQVDMKGAPVTVAPGARVDIPVEAYVGPKKLAVLNGYARDQDIDRFDLVIDFGKFWFLTIPFFHVLTWLASAIGSFAVALLVFTCIVRLAVFPLANKSYRSFARMRKIQPQMLEIREKYGEDRARLQQAIFELYKKENVNPMAGCLPLLIQIPIFFSLYKVLYISLEMRHAPFWGWVHDMSAPDPLSVATLFGLIPWNPPTLINIGIWPMIMGLTLFMQQRLNPPAQDPVQAKILGFMPVLMTLLMAHFPAGLVIYWSWSNCLSILQQYVLMKKEGVEVHFFRRSRADREMAEAVAHGPAVHPASEELKHDLEVIEGKAEEVIERPISPPKPGKKR
jgi:YidC/Oxa1 family membrane protein insertase